MDKKREFLYIELAGKIETHIVKHKLLPGDKIPSIREIKNLFSVSTSTVMQAYDLLIARGTIIAKERYGFFVNKLVKNVLEENSSLYQSLPVDVAVNEMATKMMINAKKFAIANFSILAPAPTILPITAINKYVVKSLGIHSNEAFGYPLIEGSELLLKQIALFSLTWENPIAQSELLVTNGCLEAINLCLQVVTKPGDTVVIESPTYQGILQALENHQLKAIEIPCSPADGIDLEILADVIKTNNISACVMMPRLNNPLGCSMSNENKKKLVELVTDNKIPLIEDDALGSLAFDFRNNLPAKAYDEKGYVLYCSSFSKTLSPGFRIGYVSGGIFHKALRKTKFATNIATSGILQDAIAMYLETGKFDNHLNKMRIEIQKNLFRYLQSITNYFPESTKISNPAGGLSLWIELPNKNNALELQRVALENNIGICPGNIFTTSNKYGNFIRLNYGPLWTNKIDGYIKKLGTLVSKSG
jgi:DNA-binding transcriptional MocR family regulator